MRNDFHRRWWMPATLILPVAALLSGCQTASNSTADANAASVTAAVIDTPVDRRSDLERIIDEGKHRNQVMEHLYYITEGIGPRLTGSTRLQIANEWAAEQFHKWGLTNVHLHEWGTIPVGFDRGPSYGRMVEPVEREFEFTWRAWSAGTNGPQRGPVIREPRTMEEFEEVREQLNGAWLLQPPAPRGGRRGVVDTGGPTPTDMVQLAREHGVLGVITAARGGELVHTGGARGWRNLDYNDLPTDISITIRRSDYDAINSRLTDGEEVIVEFDGQATFIPGPVPCYNTIADIPGWKWPDEMVIISAHLDSWDGPGSQGAMDNGVGSAVTLEAARILAAAGVRPKRTIRFILWSGEEQGLLGSSAYVRELSEEERSKISAVFVDDGGTNYQGGLDCIEVMVPMLSEAIAPVQEAFPNKPMKLNVRDTMPRGGASDHAAFNAVGVPGFFWHETGRANYRYAWHTQNDRYDQAIPEYLVQSSTCSAVTAWYLANAPTLLPRESPEPEEPDEAEEATETQPVAEAVEEAETVGAGGR